MNGNKQKLQILQIQRDLSRSFALTANLLCKT